MHTVILVTSQETEEIKALLEASLGSQTVIEVFPSLSSLFPDVMKLDPVLALVDGHSVQEDEIGIIHVLKSTYPSMRVLFTFRLDERDKAAKALKSGVDAYILEPYYISEFSLFLQREFKNALYRSRHLLDLRMDALATFVEGFAPEINNPLTTIRGFLQILKTGDAFEMDSDELDEIYSIMEKESIRISQLVMELENFARTRKPKRLPLDIYPLIEQAADEAREAAHKDIPVVVTIENCPPEIKLDRDQILAALKSLLAFLLAGAESGKGKVELSLTGSADKNYLNIVVEGKKTISLGQDVHKVFIPLYSRKLVRFREELGLASAYGIIRGHGGSISVTSTQDGSRFQIELPCE